MDAKILTRAQASKIADCFLGLPDYAGDPAIVGMEFDKETGSVILDSVLDGMLYRDSIAQDGEMRSLGYRPNFYNIVDSRPARIL